MVTGFKRASQTSEVAANGTRVCSAGVGRSGPTLEVFPDIK
jgi:hypothetical protein